jgi:hypothetical protein
MPTTGGAIPGAVDALQPQGLANITRSMLEFTDIVVDIIVYGWVRDPSSRRTLASKLSRRSGTNPNNEPQKLTHNRLSFRTKDRIDGRGLTEPLVHMEEVRSWKMWDVTAMSIRSDVKKEMNLSCAVGFGQRRQGRN